jgi:thiol-disulfide isomerase/thioredoxin
MEKADSQRIAELTRGFGAEVIAALKRGDPQEQRKEAEALLERITADKDYSATVITYHGHEITLREQVEQELFQLRQLAPGKPAPAIEGKDLDGKPLKLSDHRGKVVVVSFWASWCGPCMGLVPHERELVTRLKGRPFVLLGVNGDEKKESAQKAAKRTEMNWQSFWDGPAGDGDGPIARRWNVSGWPTVYLIDHRGLIVKKIGLGKEDEELIEQQVKAAEAAAKAPPGRAGGSR